MNRKWVSRMIYVSSRKIVIITATVKISRTLPKRRSPDALSVSTCTDIGKLAEREDLTSDLASLNARQSRAMISELDIWRAANHYAFRGPGCEKVAPAGQFEGW